MPKDKETPRHINPRYRAYGRARIDIAQRAQSQADWEKMWKRPQFSFPFVWGEHWKQCIEFQVDDFPAEVGFLIDVLSLPVNAFNPNIAMFTSPDHEFFFAVIPTPPGGVCTPPGALRLQFMVEDIFQTTEEFHRRGIVFDQEPQPVSAGSSQWVAGFQTPNGIPIEIWGQVVPVEQPPAAVDEQATEVDEAAALEAEPETAEETAYTPIEFDAGESEPIEAPAAPARPPVTLPTTVAAKPAAPLQERKPAHSVAESPSRSERYQAAEPRAPLRAEPQPPLAAKPAPKAETRPALVFKNGQEMLEHLQHKVTAKPAPASAPAAAVNFHPAPKPQASAGQAESGSGDEPLEYEDLDAGAGGEAHYKAIPFEDSRE